MPAWLTSILPTTVGVTAVAAGGGYGAFSWYTSDLGVNYVDLVAYKKPPNSGSSTTPASKVIATAKKKQTPPQTKYHCINKNKQKDNRCLVYSFVLDTKTASTDIATILNSKKLVTNASEFTDNSFFKIKVQHKIFKTMHWDDKNTIKIAEKDGNVLSELQILFYSSDEGANIVGKSNLLFLKVSSTTTTTSESFSGYKCAFSAYAVSFDCDVYKFDSDTTAEDTAVFTAITKSTDSADVKSDKYLVVVLKPTEMTMPSYPSLHQQFSQLTIYHSSTIGSTTTTQKATVDFFSSLSGRFDSTTKANNKLIRVKAVPKPTPTNPPGP